jgi:hypothetical protein
MKRKNRSVRVEQRRKEAIARNELYSRLSKKEKIQKLDNKLGEGQGAKKQRRKL